VRGEIGRVFTLLVLVWGFGVIDQDGRVERIVFMLANLFYFTWVLTLIPYYNKKFTQNHIPLTSIVLV
jgi:hypothetical protein